MKHPDKVYQPLFLACLLSLFACNNDQTTTTPPVQANDSNSINIPRILNYDIVHEYPHDPEAFTEGLEYKDGFLYESIGRYGHSDIRKVNLETGNIVAQTKLDSKCFGEGLTLLNGKLYQITYREGRGFIYDPATLKQTGKFIFNAAEGWGMTNNGSNLIYDDGTNVLHFLDPVTFKETRQLSVTDEHGPVKEINEPEMINGYIYANQWRTELILKIDTLTGRVVARADLGSLRQRLGIAPVSGNAKGPDVLNGIAYDHAKNRIFITGKNWPKLVEIKLDN